MASPPQAGRDELRQAVSVTEMARMLSLSRARLYGLVKEGVFCPPVYHLRSRRPFYPREIQAQNLAIRRNNVGANGEVVLFYSRRTAAVAPMSRARPPRRRKSRTHGGSRYAEVVAALRQLGLSTSSTDVAEAVGVLYPDGIDEAETGEIIRAVFRHLRQSQRRN